MKAVMYGGGNIGRGFIGALLSQSGYRVTFIDVSEAVVNTLQTEKRYPVRYVSTEGNKDVWIENVTAVNGNDTEAASEAIADCDIMATAVGARILKFIVPNIVLGLRKRWLRNAKPLNIIICENLMDANKVLEDMIKAQLDEGEKELFDKTVGLVEASIGRMVPVQTEEMKAGEPMRVCVEQYGFLPVDRAAFKGEVPQITNIVPVSPFDFYIKRKLFIHNMGHAICAYLGGFNGRKYIWQAVSDADVLCIVQNAMIDSAVALAKKYGASLEDMLMHVTDLLGRFRNRELKDTCMRVGGDPMRKLGRCDRLIGAALLAIEQGITPVYTALGAAGAVYRYIGEVGETQTRETALKILGEVSDLSPDHQLTDLILNMYDYFLDGATPAEMRFAAQLLKSNSIKDVI